MVDELCWARRSLEAGSWAPKSTETRPLAPRLCSFCRSELALSMCGFHFGHKGLFQRWKLKLEQNCSPSTRALPFRNCRIFPLEKHSNCSQRYSLLFLETCSGGIPCETGEQARSRLKVEATGSSPPSQFHSQGGLGLRRFPCHTCLQAIQTQKQPDLLES